MMQNYLLKKTKYALIVAGFLLLVSGAFAQSIAVKGKVTDDRAEPLPNATILVKGTSNGSTTNDAGEFSINVPNSKAVLVISAVGRQAKEIVVGTQTNIEVVLPPGEASELESVVVVGYATQKKVTVTGAVA